MTDAGLFAAVVLALAWLEYRDWRIQWTWRKNEAIAAKRRAEEQDALLRKQEAMLTRAHTGHE